MKLVPHRCLGGTREQRRLPQILKVDQSTLPRPMSLCVILDSSRMPQLVVPPARQPLTRRAPPPLLSQIRRSWTSLKVATRHRPYRGDTTQHLLFLMFRCRHALCVGNLGGPLQIAIAWHSPCFHISEPRRSSDLSTSEYLDYYPEMTGAQSDVSHKHIPVKEACRGRRMVSSSKASSFRGLRFETSKLIRRFTLLA